MPEQPTPGGSIEDKVSGMVPFALVAAAEQGAETERTLPMPAWAFGLLTLAAFVVLFAITWSFRSIGQRHGEPRL